MTSVIENSLKSAIIVAPAQILVRVAGMLTTIIIARNLSISDYGIYNLFIGSILVFNFFTNFGLAGSLQRFLAEYSKLNKIALLFRTFFFSISFRTITAFLIFTFAVLFFNYYSRFVKVSEYHLEFSIFCVGTFFLFQVDFLQIFFNSLFLHKYTVLVQLVCQVTRLLAVACLLIIGKKLLYVFTGELIAYSTGCLIIWGLFWQRLFKPNRAEYQQKETIEWKRFLRFSAYNAATIPGGILFSHAMDYIVLAIMSSTGQLGIYALGSRASNMLIAIMPQNLLQTVVRPAFYQHYYSVNEKNAELDKMFRSLVVLIATFLLPTLALVGVKAREILTFIFKAKFAESTPVFLILLTFSIFTMLELPSDLVLQAIEKVQARLYAQIFAVYNLFAAILLMPKFGVLGVAFATGSALMGKSLFWFFMARYYTGISFCWQPLLRIASNAAAAATTTYLIGQFSHSAAWMILSLASGGIIYLGLFAINSSFNQTEKLLINRFLKRHLFRI